MRPVAIAVMALLCAGPFAPGAAGARAAELNAQVKQAVDRANAAEKAAMAAVDLAKQAAADAIAQAKIAVERASAARSLPQSSLQALTPKEGIKGLGQMRDGNVDGLCIVQAAQGTRYEGECRNNLIAGNGVQVDGSGN